MPRLPVTLGTMTKPATIGRTMRTAHKLRAEGGGDMAMAVELIELDLGHHHAVAREQFPAGTGLGLAIDRRDTGARHRLRLAATARGLDLLQELRERDVGPAVTGELGARRLDRIGGLARSGRRGGARLVLLDLALRGDGRRLAVLLATITERMGWTIRRFAHAHASR